MFLRRSGRQVLLLHSYRDGLGRVRQRCLARMRHLGDWEEFRRLHPDWHRLEPLQPKVEELLQGKAEVQAGDRLEKAAANLLRLLSEAPEGLDTPSLQALKRRLAKVPESVGEEQVLSWRSRLSPRRRRFDPCEDPVRSCTQALEEWAERLTRDGQESLPALATRAQLCPDLEGKSQYAWRLAEVGQVKASLEVLVELPGGDAWTNCNRAALCWRNGDFASCLDFVLRSLARAPQILGALERQQKGWKALPGQDGSEYWERFGSLWDDAGRKFILGLAQIQGVRYQISRIQRQGVKMRSLLKPHTRERALSRALEAAKKPGPWAKAPRPERVRYSWEPG